MCDLCCGVPRGPVGGSDKMLAVIVREHGGPEVLRVEETAVQEPGPGQALVRLEASGVNYFDIRQRTGDFKSALPVVLGNEGAGTVEAVGPEVAHVRVGDRVGWQMEQGSYATHALVRAERLVPLPSGADAQLA